MASTKCLVAEAVCFLIMTTGVLAQLTPGNGRILDVRCDLEALIAGVPATLQELCGGNFQIAVNGISGNSDVFPIESFPWKLEATLITDATDPSNIIQSTITIPIGWSDIQNGDDITTNVVNYLATLSEPVYDIPTGKCDNRDGKGIMRLYSQQSGFDKEYWNNGVFSVLCDFSGVDLRLDVQAADGGSYVGDISDIQPIYADIDWSFTPATLISATELGDMKIVVMGDVPVLEPTDTCIFAIAFLTKRIETERISNHEECQQWGSYARMPEVTYHDVLLGTPLCLTNGNMEVIDLLQMVKDSTANVSMCGNYTLVLQVDPMHTLHNEMDTCNNYLTFDLYFNCNTTNGDMPSAHCEMLNGAFGSGQNELFDTRFIYHTTEWNYMNHETYADARIFKQDGNTWVQTHDDVMGVQKRGFGLYRIYKRYLESIDIEQPCSDLASDDHIHTAISNLEGLNDELLRTKPNTDIATLVPAYAVAKHKMDQMNISKDYQGTISDIQSMLGAMIDPGDNRTLHEYVEFMAAKSALNATLRLAEALQNGMSTSAINMYGSMHACAVSKWLEYMPMVTMWLNDKSSPENNHHAMGAMLHLAGNLTRVALDMHYLYPEFTCLEGVLGNLLHYVKEWSYASSGEKLNIDIDWMFDVDQVRDADQIGNEKLAFSGCEPKANQCVRKLQTVCIMEPTSPAEPAVNNRRDICRARFLKHQAEKQYRILGLLDYKNTLTSGHMGDKCRNDPIAPHKGPLTLWRMEYEPFGYGYTQVIYKGIPTLDNKNIMWKKVSVCTCSECHDPMRRKRK